MFSTGSGSHDGTNYPTQWALNPSAYQNVANDQVDWAALAQQWIMMKESTQAEQMPQAPPPPHLHKKEVVDEGGEAPMDVDNEKDDGDWNESGSGQQDWNWQQQQQWGWNSNWNSPSAVPPPNSVNNSKSALLPTPYSHYSQNNTDPPSGVDFQNSVPANDYTSGYWTNSSSGGRNKNANKQRIQRKGPSTEKIEPNPEPVTLDAAKRRQLPAWIREGLEKMEREKQKQLEKERERVERENYLSRKKEETEGAIKLLRSSGLPEKSKFETDSEEDRGHGSKKSSPRRRTPPASEEERSEQTMLLVRRTMTQVLLQVTSTEIQAICEEELGRFRERKTASAKKSAQYGTPGQGSVGGSLGLGMYGGESDSSGDESDGDRGRNSIDDDDDSSDAELKETIKRRKAEYSKTERDTERKSSRNEDGREVSDGGRTPDRPGDNAGDRDTSQVDARSHGSGSLKTRRYSQKSSSRTPPRKDKRSSPDSRDGRKRPSKKTKRSSSSRDSDSDSDDSTNSDSTTSSSSRERTRSRRPRSRSRSFDDHEKIRKKHDRSRSESVNSDADRGRSSRRPRYESGRGDASRRDRDRRSRSRTRRERSRDRHASKRSRSRSRSSRRSRRSRSRSRGRRSPHGGKRSRR